MEREGMVRSWSHRQTFPAPPSSWAFPVRFWLPGAESASSAEESQKQILSSLELLWVCQGGSEEQGCAGAGQILHTKSPCPLRLQFRKSKQ